MEKSKYAGKVVKIKSNVTDIGGQEYRVEDYWINVSGRSWAACDGNPACLRYAFRIGLGGNVPVDDKVLYGKVGSFGHLVHESEIESI